MPGASEGFKTSLIAMLGGLIISVAISGLGDEIPNIQLLKAVFDILAILGFISTIENANFWGIMYTIGYLAGITLFGKFLLPAWETQLFTLVLGAYIVLKVINKF